QHRADNRDGGVAGERAVAHRRRGTTLVGQATAHEGGVAGEDDVAERQRPEVVDPAAVAAAGVAPGDRQARDGHRLAGFDLEDPGDVAAADGQLVGPGAVDLHVVGEVELAAGQGDRAGQPVVEDDDVGPGVGVGAGDGVAERAVTTLGQGRDVER